jgi:hypothetical protein
VSKIKYKYNEDWDIKNEDIMTLFPVDKITSLLNMNPNFVVIKNDEILTLNAEDYNLPLFIRLYNENPHNKELGEYFYQLQNPELRNILSINLPQFLIHDKLGYSDHVIRLHISKIRKDEIFINDMVFARNKSKLLRNGIATEVIKALIVLCKQHNIKYISGHACNTAVYKTFLNKGFQADKRIVYGNDILYKNSELTGGQIPFYMII